MGAKTLPAPGGKLATAMQGVWWLLSREDWTKDGQRRIDPIMGTNPVGILAYARDRFSAQFMKRDRTDDPNNQIPHSGQNNTSSAGGYDAYFGSYQVNEETGKVAHTLIGSITPANIGLTVSRNVRVDDDKLTIQLETTTPDGELIVP
jgi:hypothetical protein